MTETYPAPDGSGWCVQLLRGMVALIDEEDIPLIAPYRWFAVGRSNKYAVRVTTPPELSVGAPTCIKMHRAILGIVYEPAILGDHINHDTLDNRRSNLRRATLIESASNSRMPTGSSGYRGVWRVASSGRWRVAIQANGRRLRGGTFDTPIEAAARYNELARLHHGAFAVLNDLSPMPESDK